MPDEQTAPDMAAKVVQNANKTAEVVVAHAKDIAKDILTQAEEIRSNDERIIRMLSESLRQVFGENAESGRFVDISRIPLICQNINNIHDNIKEIKSSLDVKYVTYKEFAPIKNIIYGFIGIVLTAVIVGLLSLIFIK
jgi:hypothetical protein